MFEVFTPKFVKRYTNISEVITNAFKEYVADVKGECFPEEKHTYKMIPGEFEKFNQMLGSLK